MNISRRRLTGRLPVLGLVAVGLLGARLAQALSADEEAVAKRLEAFRAAQFAHDAKELDGLCAEELSYSHSDAHLEDKAKFINAIMARKAVIKSLDFPELTVAIVGNNAIVRHLWVSESELDGKVTNTKSACCKSGRNKPAAGSC